MNKFTKLSLCLCLLATVLFSACEKEYDSIETIDAAAIQSYITKNNLTTAMIQDPDKTGFYYQVVNQGTGSLFKNPDSVFYDITIKSLTNGTVYSQSPIHGNLGTHVGYSTAVLSTFNFPAIRTSILALSPGGTARILLPSNLAFGKNGYNNIPSNENIDITVKTYPFRKQWLFDESKIENFLTSKGLVAVKDPSRVRYIVSNVGAGADVITNTSTLVIKYTGRFLDGTTFDSGTDGTYSTTLQQVISGWGVLKNFRAGTKVRILIPSDLAYGTTGSIDPNTRQPDGKIPANAVLDFDIEIVSVTN
jgi:FKBP-type peptidyl-prolyl cis-trans isomerase FkpA